MLTCRSRHMVLLHSKPSYSIPVVIRLRRAPITNRRAGCKPAPLGSMVRRGRLGAVSPDDFDKVVERALKRIPAPFRKRLDNIVVGVEQEPTRRGLLGLYHGVPLTERSVAGGFRMPDQITIYQGPHERMSRDREQLEEMVA